MKLILRPFTTGNLLPHLRPVAGIRTYAAQPGSASSSTGSPKRRAVTPFNDNGSVPWGELSGAGKVSRATQQTFNFGLVVVGMVLTVKDHPPASTQRGIAPCLDNLLRLWGPGGRGLFPLHRRLLARQQDGLFQPRRGSHQEGPTVSSPPRRG